MKQRCETLMNLSKPWSWSYVLPLSTVAQVTGAGDETLRFWNVFPGTKSRLREIPRSGSARPLRFAGSRV